MTAAGRQIEFWYEFASTYSYLSVMRIGQLARDADIDVVWRPFLLGPIFAAGGWPDSPFNIYVAKGRYMWRDLERICDARGLPFQRPSRFPANGLLAARIAMTGAQDGWAPRFTQDVFVRQFAHDDDISQPEVLLNILESLDLPGSKILTAASSPAIKDQLRMQTERAQNRGIFGAPSVVTGDDELFWGDDRLEAALQWAGTL